jgi:membrane fusion protein, multidrug efflux system
MKRKTGHVLLGVLWVAALALALVGCAKKEAGVAQAVEPPPVRAQVLRVEAKPFAINVAITGTLVSPAQVEVKAETTGKILQFPKQEGDRVSAGEVVVWVDDSHEKLAVKQAETAVQVAESALARVRVVGQHNASEFERAKNLLKSGGITDRDYKTAELASHDSDSQAALAEAQLAQARAQLEQARKMLNDSAVRAPVSGEIQRKYVNQGAYVEPPTPVFSIVDNARLELESMVPTADLGAIAAGQRVTFTVNSYPGHEFVGRVIEINRAVQQETRSAKVRIAVSGGGGGRLRAGMFAQGAILTGVESRAILIPAAAVYRDDRSAKSSYVFVVEQGKAVRREVQIGRETDSMLVINAGLSDGEQVLAQQSIEIAEGVKVEPLDSVRRTAED